MSPLQISRYSYFVFTEGCIKLSNLMNLFQIKVTIKCYFQGKCQDQVNVTHNHTYQQVEMNQSIPKEIDNILDKLHKALHEVTVTKTQLYM